PAPAHPTGAAATATAAARGEWSAGPGAARRGALRIGGGWGERRTRTGRTRGAPCPARPFCSARAVCFGAASPPSGGSFRQRAPLPAVGGGHTCGGAARRLRRVLAGRREHGRIRVGRAATGCQDAGGNRNRRPRRRLKEVGHACRS